MGLDVIFYWLLLSMPVRFVLYTVHVYMQNLIALLQLIRDGLTLLIDLVVFIRRCLRLLQRHVARIPLLSRLLHLLYYELTALGFLLKMTALLLRVPTKVLMRLSRLFRICAHGRTWVIMLRPR